MNKEQLNNVLEELKTARIDEYDLRDILIKSVRNKIYDNHRIYIEDLKEHKYNILSINDTVEIIEKELLSKYESWDNALIFQEFKNLGMSIKKDSVDKPDTLTLQRWNMSDNARLIYIIRYAHTGSFNTDYQLYNKIMDDNKVKYDTMNFDIKIISNISVKAYKNGKILIYGLNTEQKNRLVRGFEIKDKYNNF